MAMWNDLFIRKSDMNYSAIIRQLFGNFSVAVFAE